MSRPLGKMMLAKFRTILRRSKVETLKIFADTNLLTVKQAAFILGQVDKRAVEFHDMGQVPKGFRRGKPGNCFRTAIRAILRYPKLKYAEGLVRNQFGELIYHAWCVNEQGEAIEMLKILPGVRYAGVIWDRAVASRLMLAYQSKPTLLLNEFFLSGSAEPEAKPKKGKKK